jgi:hypothetical protein
MPNKIKRNKGQARRLRPAPGKSDSVKDLLKRAHPAIARLSEQTALGQHWRSWLAINLPAEAAAQVSSVVERHDTLVIFTATAAWSARVRFAIAEIEADLKRAHPRIAHVAVRVLPA